MSAIKPGDATLLTDLDVDYALFHCCGDEDLVFLRCEHCGHIWVECYECSTWYVDLDDLARGESAFRSDVKERVCCPACRTPFADFFYLKEGIVDRYLATAEQVIAAGFERYLAPRLRKPSSSVAQRQAGDDARALARLGLERERAAVTHDDGARDGQPEAAPFSRAGARGEG